MNKNSAIIIGGTGQYGITLGNLLVKKKINVISTGRSVKKIFILKNKYLKITFVKLDIYIIKKNQKVVNKKETKFFVLFCRTKFTKRII